MTAQEFVDKWPEAVRNGNCLFDMACLECGERDNLRIEIAQVCRVTDEGFEGCGDSDWDMESWCHCGNSECDAEGKAGHFHVEGLDDLIARRERASVHPHLTVGD